MPKRTTLATLLLSAGLLAGCATNSDLESIRMTAEQAQADASAARQAANEARALAEQAQQMSQATDERVNRLFRTSLQK